MVFKGKKVLVLGAGVSGVSASEFLRLRDAEAVIYDDRKDSSQPNVDEFDFCVISPGVSIDHPVAQKFKGRIISEVALGFQARHRKIVAVTGTNGKTTVVNMINNAINANRRLFAIRSVLCGNVGVPVTSVTHEIRRKTAVVEVSSFMMESENRRHEYPSEKHVRSTKKTFKSFKPNIAVILNLSQDHLERHGILEKYIECKTEIARPQTKRDVLILNYDCENTRRIGERGGLQQAFYFSAKSRVRGIYIDGKNVVLNIKKYPKILFPLAVFEEEKPHQILNILAAVLVAKLLRVSSRAVIKACNGSKAHENRLQHVGTVGQVMFFNDSKATNVAACLAACNCFKSPVHLLLGGVPKGQNFEELFKNLPPQVERIFCFGACKDELEQAGKNAGFKNIVSVETMSEAAYAAFDAGRGPRVVLLSPACSSFDEFENYQHRGKIFAEVVGQIEEGKTDTKGEKM